MYLGEHRLYAGGYDGAALAQWGKRIRAWSDGREPGDARRVSAARPPKRVSRDVTVYFDNDAEGRAPHDASARMDRSGWTWRRRA